MDTESDHSSDEPDERESQLPNTISDDAIAASERSKLVAIENNPAQLFMGPRHPLGFPPPPPPPEYPTLPRSNPGGISNKAHLPAGKRDWDTLSSPYPTAPAAPSSPQLYHNNYVLDKDDKVIGKLTERIHQLEAENNQLRGKPSNPDVANVQVFHCFGGEGQESDAITYLSEPYWEKEGEQIILRCRSQVPDPFKYSHHRNMSFIIFKHYDPHQQGLEMNRVMEAGEALGKPEAYTQEVALGQRFMVDFNTYKELHPYSKYSKQEDVLSKSEEYSPKGDQSPQSPEMYLFPTTVPGLDLRRKKWIDLQVDQIRDAVWNDKAFSNLVVDEDMKELILALVTNQLETEKGTDLIDNKGNGLIMLLHGSPGTGKTFTAESVAEIARKPLYPVTCGDIGTEPGQGEQYLQSVFYLGKKWDCVVLLDEAEVFLEQRTLQDLKRNALVSVFLRALEYYEGILILTTNRVGTFDEAFKSRIQLALRYEKLQGYQRKQIWRNFMARLKEIGEEDKIDFDDIQLNLDEVARYEMNGRQIRNSITTARQLAKYKGRKMTFPHLKRAITVAYKFDRYLADVQEGVDEDEGRGQDGRYSDESLARQDGVR
ncbi:AAA domain-containing protein [Fusarium sp. LHS14.1]|nr:AAA domain-containing protein [Fusarium sp. LHS14.1]